MKIKLSKIKPNPDNPRLIRDEKFEKLCKSLQDFPSMLEKRPLVVYTDKDGKYIVLGGNMRFRAAQHIGMKEIPAIIADDWTEAERKQFVIKDNVDFGDWDYDNLANNWDNNELADWGLPVPKFETEAFQLDERFGTLATETKEQNEAKMTDDDYALYEIVLLHENKLKLIDVLNQVKKKYSFEKNEEALMHIVNNFKL